MHYLLRRILGTFVVVLAMSIAVASPAAAAGRLVPVQDCLDGDAGPFDYAVQVQAGGFTIFELRCGDPTKGVLHIDAGHPIEPGSEVAFKDCIQNIVSGRDVGPGNPPNSVVRTWAYRGGTGTIVYDDSSDTKVILTAYTSNGPRGNNWRDCALGNDGQIGP